MSEIISQLKNLLSDKAGSWGVVTAVNNGVITVATERGAITCGNYDGGIKVADTVTIHEGRASRYHVDGDFVYWVP